MTEQKNLEKNECIITIVTSDHKEIEVKKEIIQLSILIKDMLEDTFEEEYEEQIKIPIPNVESKIFQKVLEYCEYHFDKIPSIIEKPLKKKIEDVICDWDKKFLELDKSFLIDLIMAANYLNIKSLLELLCAKISSMIQGKTPEQIRKEFYIKNDFTPEEELKIKDEIKWCID